MVKGECWREWEWSALVTRVPLSICEMDRVQDVADGVQRRRLAKAPGRFAPVDLQILLVVRHRLFEPSLAVQDVRFAVKSHLKGQLPQAKSYGRRDCLLGCHLSAAMSSAFISGQHTPAKVLTTIITKSMKSIAAAREEVSLTKSRSTSVDVIGAFAWEAPEAAVTRSGNDLNLTKR